MTQSEECLHGMMLGWSAYCVPAIDSSFLDLKSDDERHRPHRLRHALRGGFLCVLVLWLQIADLDWRATDNSQNLVAISL